MSFDRLDAAMPEAVVLPLTLLLDYGQHELKVLATD